MPCQPLHWIQIASALDCRPRYVSGMVLWMTVLCPTTLTMGRHLQTTVLRLDTTPTTIQIAQRTAPPLPLPVGVVEASPSPTAGHTAFSCPAYCGNSSARQRCREIATHALSPSLRSRQSLPCGSVPSLAIVDWLARSRQPLLLRG